MSEGNDSIAWVAMITMTLSLEKARCPTDRLSLGYELQMDCCTCLSLDISCSVAVLLCICISASKRHVKDNCFSMKQKNSKAIKVQSATQRVRT